MYKRSKNRIKRSVLRKEIDSFVLIGKRDAIFAQKGSARLINLCEMPKLQRKHTFLRLTIYIYIGAHFYKQNGRAWCIQLIPLASSI